MRKNLPVAKRFIVEVVVSALDEVPIRSFKGITALVLFIQFRIGIRVEKFLRTEPVD